MDNTKLLWFWFSVGPGQQGTQRTKATDVENHCNSTEFNATLLTLINWRSSLDVFKIQRWKKPRVSNNLFHFFTLMILQPAMDVNGCHREHKASS